MDDRVKKDLEIEEYLLYYSHGFYCSNCDTWNNFYIKRGVRVKDVSVECDNCGCKIGGEG